MSMSTAPLFPSFDGLLNLSKHEGVDIRPTLLRVLTDLYVQAPKHTDGERRQFAELASRLIDEVDAATRASVRARLAICDDTPPEIAIKLGIERRASMPPAAVDPGPTAPLAGPEPTTARSEKILTPRLAMRPADAAEIERMFSVANALERARILQNLGESPLAPAVRPGPRRSARAIETLEMAAYATDIGSFAIELSNVLLLPAKAAERVVDDPGGEAVACACKAIGMPDDVYQRVLLLLRPEVGASVMDVFRLARLYSVLSEHAALIMVSVWRGATVAQTQARYRPSLYDDERSRARPPGLSTASPAVARRALPQTNRTRSGA
jgi:uncharacterized protein (DUF2336 family)